MAKAQAVKQPRPVSRCSFCGAVFKKLEHAQRHERTHTLDRPYECKALGCGKTFARQDTLTRHFRLHTRDQEGVKKIKDVPLILPGRRRTKSAEVPSSTKRREERERRATESYLPSPAPSDGPSEFPAPEIALLCLPPLDEERLLPSPLPPLPLNPADLFEPYATPESIVSPLPSYTADSAAAAAFDLGDHSSTSDDSNSLASFEDDLYAVTHTGMDFEGFFTAFEPASQLQYQPAMEPYAPINALRMHMGEPCSPHESKPMPAFVSAYGHLHQSYLAP